MARIDKKRRWPAVTLITLLVVMVLAGAGIYFGYSFFMEQAYPLRYEDIVTREAEKYDIDPALVYGVIRSESSFRPEVVSHAGAIGLMQLTPETFDWLQKKINDGEHMASERLKEPEVNIAYGVFFLSLLKERFQNEREMLAAYNAGMGAVSRWLEDGEYSADGETLSAIPYPETEAYIERVLQSRDMYHKLYFEN